ncbi:hypothetical protein [Mariniblastus fucicola]|uniref:Suppressor of fused protein (SUFU) n=1 Tax=Mariniblastus fucicola TaxID=980251 RepID=A0A5B9PJ87_9BACT|nr:hypothetical protein [Mariniblastus fucicola]QEG24716.1 hypothetical protein MFFC18_46380 [Mariniblastus fucicola]
MATFKTNVEAFWKWFATNAAEFYAAIEDGNCAELAEPVQEACGKWLPGFSWVFGPGPDGKGHSFTITGEGKPGFLFLASYWLELAPVLDGWTFYGSRQPSVLHADHQVKIADQEFGPGEILIKPIVYEEDEQIGIDFWHPNFADSEEGLIFTVLGIWLDESLGEIGSMAWIASAECKDLSGDPEAFPLTKLKQYVDYLQKEKGWEKLPPDETYSLYQLPEQSDEFPRGDTISGTTCNMELVGAFLESAGHMEDPVEGTGASFVYIGINRDQFPEGDEVNFRAEIEDAVDEALRSGKSGRVFGGAFGLISGYIDLVIYDGDNSAALINQALDAKGLGGEYFVRPFAKA